MLGDSDFVANGFLRQVPTNVNLFVNSINWLAEDEDLISIRSTPARTIPIVLNNEQSVLVFFTTVVFVPGVVLLLGIVVWWQRR